MGQGESTPFVPGLQKGSFIQKDTRGRALNIYNVDKALGSGAFGQVFKVIRAADSHTFALKLIPLENPQAETLVMKEVMTLGKLKHNNVVGFVASFSVETTVPKVDDRGKPKSEVAKAICVVMDFIDGQNLHDILEGKSKRPVSMVMAWFLKILEATAYIHEKGCVHRDMKPANIVITAENDLKIVDFGISAFVKPQAVLGKSMRTIVGKASTVYVDPAGTPAYLDPTVIEDFKDKTQTKLDPSCDVWALGVILYNTLTGQDLDFLQKSLEEGKNKAFEVVAKEVKKLHDPSGALQWLLNGMLCPTNVRKTTQELFNSDEIKSWRCALDPSKEIGEPNTVTELMPFVAVLMDLNVPAVIRAKNFERILGLFNLRAHGSQYKKAAMQVGIMHALVLHLDDESMAGAADSELVKLLVLGLLSRGAANEDLLGLLGSALGTPVRKSAIKCLYELLNDASISTQASESFYSFKGAVPKLWSLVAENQDQMGFTCASCLGLLIRQASYATICSEYQLKLMLEAHPAAFEIMYAQSPLHSSPNLFGDFVDHLLTKKPDPICATFRELFKASRQSLTPLLKSETTQTKFGALILQAMQAKQFQKIFESFMLQAIRHMLQPFTELTMACANSGVCTHFLSDGVIPIAQPLIVCKDCGVPVCVSCSRQCHLEHDLNPFYRIQFECGVCGCKTCKSRGASKVNAELQPPENRVTLNEPYLGDAKSPFNTVCTYWEDRRLLRINSVDTVDGEDSIQLFHSRGIQFDSSIRGATFWYFEVSILEIEPHHRDHAIGIGIGPRDGNRNHMVGWAPNEFGYHSDDGKLFAGAGKGVTIGLTYGEGDVIGCGIKADGTVYFSRNGYFLRDSKTKIPRSMLLFATVSCRGLSCRVQFNFDGPFKMKPNVSVSMDEVVALFNAPNLQFIKSFYCGIPVPSKQEEKESALAAREERWACLVCTFENEVDAEACAMCDKARVRGRGLTRAAALPHPGSDEKRLPSSVTIRGAGSTEVNGEYVRTTQTMDDVPKYCMQKTSEGVNKIYHICRSVSSKTKTKKWWICRTDRNGIENDIDFYILDSSADIPPTSGWSVHKGSSPSPTIAIGPLTAWKPTEPGVGIMLGSEVNVSQNYEKYSDAKNGPLAPGAVGIVVEEDDSDKPFRVKLKGASDDKVWWYAAEALVLDPRSPIIREPIIISWPRIFSYIFSIKQEVAGYVLWTIRCFDPELYQNFAGKFAPNVNAISEKTKLLSLLLGTIHQKGEVRKAPPPKPPPSPVMPPLESYETNNTTMGKDNDPPQYEERPSVASTPMSAQLAAGLEEAKRQSEQMAAMMQAFVSQTRFGTTTQVSSIPILVRASHEEDWNQEIIIEREDSFEIIAQKACDVLGKPRTKLKKIEKVVEGGKDLMLVQVQQTTQIRALARYERLVIHFH